MQPVAARRNGGIYSSAFYLLSSARQSKNSCSEPTLLQWVSKGDDAEPHSKPREEIKVLYLWSWMLFFLQYRSIQNTCFSFLLGSKPCHVASCTVFGHMVSNAPWSYTYHKNSTGRIILETSLMGQKYPLEETDCESTCWGCYLAQYANFPAVQIERWIALKTK